MDANEQKRTRMLEAPVERLVIRLAVPSMITMLISSLYNMADTYFVGSFPKHMTSAITVALPLMAIIQAVGFFFGHGSGNYISRALGSGDSEQAEAMAATGYFSALLSGAVIMLLGLLFLDELALLLGATAEGLPYAKQYLLFILVGAPFFASSLVLNNLLRFQGSAFYGMIGVVSGAVLNIGLDPLFIFTFDMGISGASVATAISQAVSSCLLLIGCSRKGNVAVRLRSFRPKAAHYREILRGGFPSLCRQGLGSFAAIILNQFARVHGDAVLTAIGIAQRLSMFASSALLGFGQGFQPVCGFNYGAGRYDRVRKAFGFCVKVSTVFLCAMAALGAAFAPELIGLFKRGDTEVISIGARTLRLQCASFPLLGWIVINNMMLQTMGRAVGASVLALARQGMFLLPVLIALATRWGVLGIQLSAPIADALTFALAVPMGIVTLKRTLRDRAVIDNS